MKKSKNTFILSIILIICVIVIYQIFSTLTHTKNDTRSYFSLLQGQAQLNEKYVDVEQKYILHSGDKISTSKESLALIEWGDGSLTRLWENTKITIENNQVSRDYTNIQISFDLIAGKTWSHVISFISNDSQFKQSFNGVEAGVRGTVFDVDLENDYIRALNHRVSLKQKDSEKNIILSEGEVLSINNFQLIELVEFLANLKENAWTQLNEKYDQEYKTYLTDKLPKELEIKNPFLFILEYFSPSYRLMYELDTSDSYDSVEKVIKDIPKRKYQKVYDTIFARYQKMNFVDGNNYNYYKRKVFYKKALVALSSSESQKEQLIETSVYDLQDLLQSKKSQGVTETLEFLKEHKDTLKKLDIPLFPSPFAIPEWLQEVFRENFSDLKSMFPDIKNSAQDTLDGVRNSIHKFLDKNVWKFIEQK